MGPAWAGLLPGRNPPTEGYTCVCSSAVGVGWGGVGSGVLQQEEEVGLGDGVEKGEVLHQAWALEAKASRASRPCPSPRWLPHGSGLTHTHSPGLRRSFPPPCSSQWAPWPGAPSLDESSQSSSLLCVTQSRGPGNRRARHAWRRGPQRGLCPTRVWLCHHRSPRHGAPRRRESGGPAGQAEEFGSAAPISYHSRVLLSSSHSLPHTHLESG